MTKFCTKCGKKLEDGQKCTCEKIKRETKTFENAKEIYEKSEIVKIVEKFLDKPIDTLSNLKNHNFNSYILLIITSLVAGLLGTVFSFRGFSSNIIATSVMTFITLLILTFTTYLLFNSNKKLEFNAFLEITAVSSITLMAGFFIAFIFSFISAFVSLIITTLTILLFIINLYHGILLNVNYDKNKIGYLFISSILLSLVLLMFLISIL